MGLDMYLRGEKFYWTDWDKPEGQRKPMMDGFELSSSSLSLGYWRKHPNLHGYIVSAFGPKNEAGAPIDNCGKIYLSIEEITQIMNAIVENRLPLTKGFFFGESEGTDEEKERDLAIFRKAIKWVEEKDPNVSRSIYYQASW